MRAPAAIATRTMNSGPRQRTVGGTHVIEHKEYIASIVGSATYAGPSFQINPGLAATFPWLSTQANSWEMYRFLRLQFTFVSDVGSNTVGRIIITPEYDPDDAPPTTIQEAYAIKDTVASGVWTSLTATFRRELMGAVTQWKNIRNVPVLGTKATYDVGFVTVATNAVTPGLGIGDFFVEYAVELKVPQLGGIRAISTGYPVSDFAITPYPEGKVLIPAAGLSLFNPVNYAALLTLSDQIGIGAPTLLGVYTTGADAYGWNMPAGNYLVRISLACRPDDLGSVVDEFLVVFGTASAASGLPAPGFSGTTSCFGLGVTASDDLPGAVDATFPATSTGAVIPANTLAVGVICSALGSCYMRGRVTVMGLPG